jgi:hypothetical protein
LGVNSGQVGEEGVKEDILVLMVDFGEEVVELPFLFGLAQLPDVEVQAHAN